MIAISYEIEAAEHRILRLEPTFFDFLSGVGGLGSILIGISRLVGMFKNTQMFVTSSMMK